MDDTDDFDQYELADKPSYSPERYYCLATDGRGHSEQVNLKLPPGLMGQIHAMVAGRTIPKYRTAQDFLRDAALHWLKYRNDEVLKSETVAREIELHVLTSGIEEIERSRMDREQFLAKFTQECQHAVVAENLYDLNRLLEYADTALLGLREKDARDLAGMIRRFTIERVMLQEQEDRRLRMEWAEMQGDVPEEE